MSTVHLEGRPIRLFRRFRATSGFRPKCLRRILRGDGDRAAVAAVDRVPRSRAGTDPNA